MTGWVKRWFVLSWTCGILLFVIGAFFQIRDGKPVSAKVMRLVPICR